MELANFKPTINPFESVPDNADIRTIKRIICGKLINKGTYRRVYELKKNPDYVVKIEWDMTCGTFANVTEWRNYINYKDWDFLGPWLAPCEGINQTGQVLIQQRVTHKRRKDYPTRVPAMLTDLKLSNFGWIGDQFVCCDYSFFHEFHHLVGTKKMRYAKWWGTLKHLKNKV